MTIFAERKMKIDPAFSSQFIIEAPKVKVSWDFLGWAYLEVETSVGKITEQWRRVYFGGKQRVQFNQPSSPYSLVLKVVDWMPSLTTYDISLKCWRWYPVYEVNYAEQKVGEEFSLILPVNFNRKEYDFVNLGVVPIEIYWGESSVNTIRLNPGFGLEKETDKRSLSARSTSGTAIVRFVERSEV